MGKYLGVSITGRAPRKSDYQYLIDQVKGKLSSWKSRHLSLVGRVTLSKAVIEVIPIYPMMVMAVPKTCLQEIQRLQRNFIWGHDDAQRKVHAVRWSKVTLPKYQGGLGIRDLSKMNTACLMKLGWDVRCGRGSLWCQVLRGKYGRGNADMSTACAKMGDSSLWINLTK